MRCATTRGPIAPRRSRSVLSEFVRAERPQLAMLAGAGIELDCALASPDPTVSVSPLELRQVLWHLVIDASEAIRTSPGSISIETGEIWADAELLATGQDAPDLPEGRYASLCVSHSGRALDAQSASRRTAPALAALRRHGGWIGASAAPDHARTRFQVLLRRSRPHAQPLACAPANASRSASFSSASSHGFEITARTPTRASRPRSTRSSP